MSGRSVERPALCRRPESGYDPLVRALLLLLAALGAGCKFDASLLRFEGDAGQPVDQGAADVAGDARRDAPPALDAPDDAAPDDAAPDDAAPDDAAPDDAAPQADAPPQQDACVPSCVGHCGGDADGCGGACPDPCHGHGYCSAAVCTCTIGYDGAACDTCASSYVGYPDCVACGASGKPCCTGGACGMGEDCVTGTCRPQCAADMTRVNDTDVCIDRFEASKNGSAAQSVAGATPWAHLTQAEAASGCSAAGKRLCTTAEWQGACGGPGHQSYPYGTAFLSGRCNDKNGGQCLGDGSGVLPTGSLAGCNGFYPGVFDLSGNVWEWLADITSLGCTSAGGSVDSCADPVKLSCASPKATDCSLRWNGLGFRCCQTQGW
jgi:hypothetical protein